ncbi:helix-turn-helix transcriptional regulator [Paenibacillus plantarum]|uniref:helix-turn-helix transcriptional regulator n=1 Tax=Paenibacillus plantarum TaxID=2654975 RepID=UPI0014921AFB|nr:AraC family transcriptional regulator [Paenibacillus plantarum]
MRGIKFHTDIKLNGPSTPLKITSTLIDDLLLQTVTNLNKGNEIELLIKCLEEQFNEWHTSKLTHLKPPLTPKKALLGPIDTRLIIVNRYIRTYYYLPLTLHDIASLIQCNPVYLSNTYTKVFGISPIKHLQTIKMQKAQELLQDTMMSIGDIANQLGYISCSQFGDLYKRYFHYSPTQYRKMNYRGILNDRNGN